LLSEFWEEAKWVEVWLCYWELFEAGFDKKLRSL
jgi:hypothetical protein